VKVLLTGASGIVGRLLRPYLAETYDEVVLNSRSEVGELRPNETWVRGDLREPGMFDRLMEGADGAIHLAGVVGPDFDFDESLEANVVAVYRLFEAARRFKVRRVVYASSHHAVGFLERGARIDHETPPRADSWYGFGKAAGEILASHAADRYGLDVMCIRIGYVGETVPDERRVHTWCSARDLASLVRIGLTGPQKGFHMVYGVSRCPEPMFDNRHAESLGYSPQDSSLDHLADPALAYAKRDPSRPEQRYVGGHFAVRKPGEEA